MDENSTSPTNSAPATPTTNKPEATPPTSSAAPQASTPSSAPPAAAPAASLPLTPDTWPGAFGAYKFSKQAVRLNLTALVLVYVISIIFSMVQYIPKVGLVISIIVSALIAAAPVIVFLAGAQGKKIDAVDALKQSPKYVFNYIGLYLLSSLVLIVAFLLFIIPFFIVLPRIALAYYFMVDQNQNFVDAFSSSWKATKGHSGKVWGIIGASFAMGLLFFTIIGIPFAIYFLIMYSAATAILYEFIKKSPAAAVAAAAPVASTAPVAAADTATTPTAESTSTPAAAPPTA